MLTFSIIMHKALARQEQVCQAEADIHLIARGRVHRLNRTGLRDTNLDLIEVWTEVELDVGLKTRIKKWAWAALRLADALTSTWRLLEGS